MADVKVSQEVAEKEIESWLDYIETGRKKKEAGADLKEILVDAVMDGILVLNEDKTLTQKLKFPLGEKEEVKILTYKPRVKLQTMRVCTQGIKNTDALGLQAGVISALTGTDRNIINQMEMVDFNIGQAISVFF